MTENELFGNSEQLNDTISRQAAIDALGEKPLAWTEGEYELGLQNQWQSDVDALNGLPSAQPEQKWIPCSERLPEEGEVVLTQAKFKDDMKMAVSSRIDYNYWTGWGTRDINIIAWQPLPTPYREGGQDD